MSSGLYFYFSIALYQQDYMHKKDLQACKLSSVFKGLQAIVKYLCRSGENEWSFNFCNLIVALYYNIKLFRMCNNICNNHFI